MKKQASVNIACPVSGGGIETAAGCAILLLPGVFV
jgi:hypothetical protein